MPGGMTGYDVARWVASNKPEISVILCSGYNEGDRSGDAGSIADVVFLGKPYSRSKLARALTATWRQQDEFSFNAVEKVYGRYVKHGIDNAVRFRHISNA